MLLVRRRDPERRDRAAARLPDADSRLRAPLLGVPDRAERPLIGSHARSRRSSRSPIPIGDVLLLAAVIRFAVEAGRSAPAFYLLFASTSALLATDCAYNYALLHDTYHHQVIYDVGWLAYSCSGARQHCIRRCGRSSSLPSSVGPADTTRLALLAIACLIAPGIRFVEEIGNADLLVVVGASGDPVPARRARVAGLARQEERATAREITLARRGLALVEGVGRASTSTTQRSLPRKVVSAATAKVRLVPGTTTPQTRRGSNGAGAWLSPPSTGRIEWLR